MEGGREGGGRGDGEREKNRRVVCVASDNTFALNHL